MTASTRRTIVITGATRGLGRSLAERFADLGHLVLGCGRSQADIKDLRTTLGPENEFDVLDVSQPGQVDAWAKGFIDRFGPPDLLINNAAIITPNAPLWQVSIDDFDAIVDINIKGVFYIIRGFVPAMIARGSGVIVNMSSGWGRSTSSDVAPYCATKWAIEGLTRALAQELPPGLAAVPVNPGVIDTEMLRSCFGEAAEHYPSPDDWSRLAVPFLLQIGPKDNGKPLTVPA